MKEDWKECKLGEVCYFAKDKVSVSELNNDIYISTENMMPNRGGITKATNLPTGEQTPSFESGDILVSNIRPYFKKIWKSTFSGGCSADVLNFKAKNNIANDFLYYVLSDDEFFKYCMTTSKGTKMPRGDKVAIMQYPITLPPLATQQKIAAILSSLDDKIELNNKINDNLEQQAQAIFKRFLNNSSKLVKFTDVIDILGGGTPKTNNENYWNGDIPFFTPKDVGNPYCLITEKTITKNGLENCNSKLYPVNTIFVTARGTVGKVCLAGLPMAMNQSCYALKSKDNNQLLAYFYTLEVISSLKYKANGATFDAIVTRDFETETITVLSNTDSEKFTYIVESIYEQILFKQQENIRLTQLRDTLLPKLMNGEIEVDEVKV